ncbi:BRO family protein [Pseudomonas tohonis]|nr:hypothetical protein L682_25170 [Pseudomonas alcaligenes OT 69]MDN4144672.1 BRO family protein [Pseudomonas tohonis]
MPNTQHCNVPHPDQEILIPTLFTRHKRLLRAVLLEDQPWFVVTDLARLMNHPPLAERLPHNLDDDQMQIAWIRNGHGDFKCEWLVSESGAYAALIHYYHPENRCIRQWLTQQVIPCLRAEQPQVGHWPVRSVAQWMGQELQVLHWQDVVWLPLEDCPRLLPRPPHVIG